jgi:nucleotide-binding universal stress UspA family protein
MKQDASPRKYTILVGIDFSEFSALALREAVALARTHEQSEMHLVHSLPGMPPLGHPMGSTDLTAAVAPLTPVLPDRLTVDMTGDVRAFVEKALSDLDGPDARDKNIASTNWISHIRMADPAHAIAQLAADIEADLVVVGTHGRTGIERLLLGSVAEGVVRLAPCPVLVVRLRRVAAVDESIKIEPPCPQCLEVRQASGGAQFWCDRHSEHHARAHTYHFTPFRESHQSGLLLHPFK